MSRCGLACDNLEAVELVTAPGDVLQVNAGSHPDLLWALLRGGGGNFGVATALTYRLHQVSMVTGGLIAHPIDAGPDLLRFYRDAVADASDDLTVFAGLVHAPDGLAAKLSALVVCHAGDPDTAARELAPFLSFGSPALTQVGPMPYPQVNTLLDAGYPQGSLNYWLSSFTRGLTDALIDVALERFVSVPSTMTAILLEHFHGAVTRIAPADTAARTASRLEPPDPSVWTDPAATEANVTWTRETYAALAPHFAERRWLNYLGDDQADDAGERHTGQTTTGYGRSSAAMTPPTSFTSTTTSRHDHKQPARRALTSGLDEPSRRSHADGNIEVTTAQGLAGDRCRRSRRSRCG